MRACWLLAVLFVSGCATNWYNPNLPHSEIERQFQIDSGYCTGAAYGSVPMPPPREYAVDHTGPYYFGGTVNTYGPNGLSTSSYSGTAYGGGSFAQGFTQGLNNGMALGEQMAADDARKRVYTGCMVSLGWTTRKVASRVDAWKLKQEYYAAPPPKAFAEGSNYIVGWAVERTSLEDAKEAAVVMCRKAHGENCAITETSP